MDFLKTLEAALKKDERLVAEDGSVIKSKAYDLGIVGDATLLKILIENSDTKKHFFKDIDGVLVFDSMKFGWTVAGREFLPDSYTKYKNKIGLVDHSGRSIAQSKDVSLVWPYKDCVLEGGQTKEDQKRNEIFYNETLASDEVDRLLYPKILTNSRRYTKGNVEENIRFKDEDNLVIKGNNLIALSSALKHYEGQVKLIYIDPPFNTGGDSFKYNDSFNHSSWLTFMKNRLELARDILSPDGVIFIHIDHNEAHYLKVLADEIFGRENFLNEIVWCYRERETSKRFFNKKHDIIFFYAKNQKSNYAFNYELISETYSEVTLKKFKYTDENGRKYRLRTRDGDSDPATESENTYRQYLDEESGPLPRDWFLMPFLNQASSERVGFGTQKPEALIEKFILATTKEGDIVLDFFAGSGTTAAVAHKYKRRYITIEQMNEQISTVINRLQKVMHGDDTGVSKNANWHGGGSFVYCELKQLNQQYIEKAMTATTENDLMTLFHEVKRCGFISQKVNPADIDVNAKDFVDLSFEDKRRILIEIINKNMLYVNLCDMDDAEFGVTEEEKAFTNSFYGRG